MNFQISYRHENQIAKPLGDFLCAMGEKGREARRESIAAFQRELEQLPQTDAPVTQEGMPCPE